MSEWRCDPLTGDISLLARERAERPRRIRPERGDVTEEAGIGPCPLCVGNESLCPPELSRVTDTAGKWIARSFPNRYPALNLEAGNPVTRPGRGEAAPGFGVHEVIVESPSHQTPFWELPPVESAAPLEVLQMRLRDLRRDRRLRSFQVFRNRGGLSGGSIEHPHLQLVGSTFLPPLMERLLDKKGCSVCRWLESELSSGRDGARLRVLSETPSFAALSDFAPRYAHQFSVFPKRHDRPFDGLTVTELQDFSQFLGSVLTRFELRLGSFPFNLVFFLDPPGESFHWFVRIYPRLARHAGFELSSGIALVSTAPEESAREFREGLR